MTDLIKLELIKIIVPAIAAAGGIVAAVLGFINKGKIREVKVAINGRMEQLLELARNQGRMEALGRHQLGAALEDGTYAPVGRTYAPGQAFSPGGLDSALAQTAAAALRDARDLIAEKAKNNIDG